MGSVEGNVVGTVVGALNVGVKLGIDVVGDNVGELVVHPLHVYTHSMSRIEAKLLQSPRSK